MTKVSGTLSNVGREAGNMLLAVSRFTDIREVEDAVSMATVRMIAYPFTCHPLKKGW